jgi:hypothetical protein
MLSTDGMSPMKRQSANPSPRATSASGMISGRISMYVSPFGMSGRRPVESPGSIPE